MIKQIENAYFTDVYADFYVRDRKIVTNNGLLVSAVTDLYAKGWIDFDQNLYFDIVPRVTDVQISGSSGVIIDPNKLLHSAISITCSGKLPKPSCKGMPHRLKSWKIQPMLFEKD